MKPIYLDYSSTTPLDAKVRSVMLPYLKNNFGNPSSIHSFGRESKVILEKSRKIIAELIDAEPNEITFTSGGSESDNQAIIGAALLAKRELNKNHFIISAIEHHSVLHSAEYLKKLGFEYSVVPVNEYGFVEVKELKKLITKKTFLISVMFVNNEIGTIQNIYEIGKLAKENKILFHSDAVQAFGKINISTKKLPVDILSFSAHKIYGPKGIGATYIRKNVNIDSFIHGGPQERGMRAGTENIALIAGFAEAAKISHSQINSEQKRISSLKYKLLKKLNKISNQFIINGDSKYTIPNITSLSFDSSKIKIDGEALLLNLDLEGIAISSGSACTSGSIQPSHVLLAMGRDKETALATLRISIGRYTTLNEIEKFTNILLNIVKRIGK